MHDGSVPTLEAVIDLYDRGGIDRPSRSELIHPLGLTAEEKADLLAFLKTLSGDTRVVVSLRRAPPRTERVDLSKIAAALFRSRANPTMNSAPPDCSRRTLSLPACLGAA